MLEVRLIGGFDIQHNGSTVLVSSRTAQSLFAYLILTAGTTHRREKLAGMFWPDAREEKARAYLRHELWRIRKALSSKSRGDYILADGIHISFNPSAEYWLDVAVLANAGERASIQELRDALAVYHGELLPGFYEEWLLVEREHLQTVYEQKIARLLELLEKEECWTEILEWAERWISLGGSPEAAFRYLMIAYDALGDRAKVASTHERCIQTLRELDLEPSEQTRALLFKRTSKLNIPIPLTSFIGRANELNEVAELLSKSRLVTLTGSGGVGKTRLAIQVVPDVLARFPDGVWFLDLAPIIDPFLVPSTLANLLGLRESGEVSVTDLLVNYFRSRTALVIFDNCEHLIDSCAQLINSLLTSCENLAVLATSRETLRVSGEIPYRIPSLEIPKSDAGISVEDLAKIESVRLFLERASPVSSRFTVHSQDVLVICQIARRLDGIPLALELAAARVGLLSVAQILRHLDDRFKLLTNGLRSALPRHQTLRAMIEWSYDLLSEKERVLFRRLAVFMGGWTLESAEAVCAGDDITAESVMELLSQLVNKSLVLAEQSRRETHYYLLETLRQYSNEKLVESGERDRLRDKHLRYFLNLSMTAEPYLIRAEQLEWLPLLDSDRENLRLAFEWSLSKENAEDSQNLCTALCFFWIVRGYWLEGIHRVKQALVNRSQNESVNGKVARARALYTSATLEWQLGNFEQILAPAKESLELSLEISNRKDIAIATFHVGSALMIRGVEDDDQALSLLQRSFAEFEALDEPFWQARCFRQFGYLLAVQAKIKFDDFRLKELKLARRAGERLTLGDVLYSYGAWLSSVNRPDEAATYAEESDRLYKQIGAEDTSANSVVFAEIAWIEGDYQKARSLYMELQKRLSLLGDRFWPSFCKAKLALLSEQDGDLKQAQAYLEEALALSRQAKHKPFISLRLAQLSNLYYLQGNREACRQNFRESLSFKSCFDQSQKAYILMAILGALYFQKPESSARLMGVVEQYEQQSDQPLKPSEKPYWNRAEYHIRKNLGNSAFESEFTAGRKMSLDEALNLALNNVEEL